MRTRANTTYNESSTTRTGRSRRIQRKERYRAATNPPAGSRRVQEANSTVSLNVQSPARTSITEEEAEVNTKQAKTFLLFAMIAIIRSFT